MNEKNNQHFVISQEKIGPSTVKATMISNAIKKKSKKQFRNNLAGLNHEESIIMSNGKRCG